ncbi:hypothetical protein CPB84DRAFT_1792141 [Gymnopilus junonius]|uniref:Uncharacterized protein n=1 Tax=Gymnopilus junonius TaxID=109634 RepID=A0A9P5TJ11_GYMJU|nr:hypothetical protein CPB84DRAFT_1792141 [Gymnopilus junonius]
MTLSTIQVLFFAALPIAYAVTFEVHVGAPRTPGCSPASFGDVAAGSIVNFVFHPGNNTVTQAVSNDPCSVLDGGFDTGLVAVSTGTTTKSYVIPAETEPLYFSCGDASKCQSRSIFTISTAQLRAPSSNTFQVQAIQARQAGPTSVTSLDASNTLGSHNPSTFSGGSIALPSSIHDGPTGSVTDSLVLSTTTHPTPSSTGSTSGSTTVSGSGTGTTLASASTTSGTTSGAETTYIRKSLMILGPIFLFWGFL